jgi:Tol biopolymer transport system component
MSARSHVHPSRTPIAALRRVRLAVAFCAVLWSACSEDSTAPPQRGTIRVVTETSGGDQDIDGYVVVLDGDASRLFPVNGSILIPDVRAGTHVVALERVADNCSVSGDHQRSLNVTAGQPVDITFDIVCAATAIAVTTHTTGSDFPNTYEVTVIGRPPVILNTNDSLVVASRLVPGEYTVELQLPGENCTIAGAARKNVQVAARAVTPVSFEITCGPPIRLKRIAFVVDTTVNAVSNSWVMLANVDGSNPVRLALGSSPTWSPDGTKLGFSDAHCLYSDYYGYIDCAIAGGVVIMDPETRSITRLAGGEAAFSPAWSPTGDAIAFVRCCDRFGQPGRLFVLAIQESRIVELTVPNLLEALHPVWSRDGRRIAFTCILDQGNFDVCVVNRDGSGFVRLTGGATAESDPAWSPDGSRIALTRNADVDVFTLADSNFTRLSRGREPAWSPDGSKLVFGTDSGLATINPDGSNFTRLTIGQGQHAPAWRP